MLQKEIMERKKKAARSPTLSGTALCEHAGAGSSGEAIRNSHLQNVRPARLALGSVELQKYEFSHPWLSFQTRPQQSSVTSQHGWH